MVSTGSTPSALAHDYALGAGLSFAASLLADYRGNIRNLVRADIMALCSLYFLTLAEFLTPQSEFDVQMGLMSIRPALNACILGFAAIAIGRHYSPRPPESLMRLTRLEPRPQVPIVLFSLCLVFGYINMLIAVDFDFGAMIDYFMAPRFAQPWGRGKFGDWKALLFEVSMVLYLIPPIAGAVLADRKKFSRLQLGYVAAGFGFTLFFGFTSGTRNIFATYLATFLVAYAFAAGRRRSKEVIAIVAISGAAMIYATTSMLQFRNIGFYNYLHGAQESDLPKDRTHFFVDDNLSVIAVLMRVFPDKHDYLGFEIPYLALIRPIPRAMWPGKPEGMSMSIEKAVGAGEGYTVAASFIGEAYMSGGLFGVVIFGGVLGMAMACWNRLGSEHNTPFGYLIYASGFFAAVMSMRSLLVFTTDILPTIALIAFSSWLVQAGLARHQRHAAPPPDA
jgi:oligosaccharide repeat unit polymerase